MSTNTGIEWTDATWNPIRGCSRVSEGCRHCYAELVAARFSGPGQPYEGLARRRSNGEPQWTGEVRVIEEHLVDPLRWRKPRRVFVNSMSDLFHEKISDETLDRIFAVMALAPEHTFQILTKRPERMQQYIRSRGPDRWPEGSTPKLAQALSDIAMANRRRWPLGVNWPMRNVWLGVSVENQAAADERIPLLLETSAAVRFLSCEPLLGPVDLSEFLDRVRFSHDDGRASWYKPLLNWVIVGGESGPGARPCDVQWIRSIVEQCAEHEVAVFVKQLGSEPGFKLEDEERRGNPMPSFHHAVGDLFIKKLSNRKGGDPEEWPAELRVREMPTSTVPA